MVIEMINIDASVIEFEPDNSYKVIIKGVYAGIITDNGEVDDSVISFESALSTIVEIFLSCDYDYVETARGLSRKGRPLRRYVISIDNCD